MSDKVFRKIIFIVVILGIISLMGLIGYTFWLHEHCSIISYIANGR